MLNLLNELAEDKIEVLSKSSRDPDSLEIIERRRLDIYVSHTGEMISFGYGGDDLVWFSRTPTTDLLITRRIYDCMMVGVYYRKTTVDTIITAAGIKQEDLDAMCFVCIDQIQTGQPEFSGCLVGKIENGGNIIAGENIAKYMAVLPQRLKAAIPKIGQSDDIHAALQKDYKALESLKLSNVPDLEKGRRAVNICTKWQRLQCLKMSERASIRSLYHKVCNHQCLSLSD